MRWFVDVSPIGNPAPTDRYCFEAEQWESAVSQARTLRGENGAAGVKPSSVNADFRAVDPSRDVEYVATRAPDDTPVTMPPAAPSTTQRSLQACREPDYQVVKERAEDPSEEIPLAYREFAYAIEEGATRPELQILLWARFREVEATLRGHPAGKFVQLAVFDHVFDDRPLRAPLGTLMWKDWRGEPVLKFNDESQGQRGSEVRVVSAGKTAQPEGTSEPVEAGKTTGTDATEAQTVQSGDSSDADAVISRPIIAVSARQEADAEPARADSSSPSPAKPAAPRSSSLKPVSVKPPPSTSLKPVSVRPPAAKARPDKPTPKPSSAAPSADVADADWTSTAEAIEAVKPESTGSTAAELASGAESEPAATEPATTGATIREPPTASTSSRATTSPSEAPSQPPAATTESPAAPQVAPEPTRDQAAEVRKEAAPAYDLEEHHEPIDRETKPAIQAAGTRRQPGEDLIGELFDAMHDLHFMRDMVSGVEFVLGILTEKLPSEVALVHVFDINTRAFVVVRAKGPGTHTVVLHRTDDRDPFFQSAMRRSVTTRIDDARSDERFANGRWSKIECRAEAALFGPVNLGGRYLGAIELVNPVGGGPFFESEAHGLDYICEQFAEFLASRPLVLEDDVVLGLG